jgi:DNA-binding transcriptional LysR family regulator
VDEAEAAVSSATNAPRGHLRITAPATFSYRHVAPHLPLFSERYPDIEIDMIISDEYVDLIENNVDLAIRISVMKDSSLIARKLAQNPRTLFASPSYIEKYGKPKHPDQILDHNLITFRQGSPYNDWHFLVDGKIKLIHAKGKLQLNHGDAILRSAINGGGLAMLSRFVVGRHLAAGNLVSILDEYVQEDVPIYAVYPSGKHLSPKVRAFLDFLIEIYGPVPYWDEKGDHNSDAAKRTII